MANNIHDSEDSNFEITSKRRKGFPSETQVKRGMRVVHGIRSSAKSWAETTSAHAAQDAGFKNCCMYSGRYDGSLRNHFFPRIVRSTFCGPKNMGYQTKAKP